MNIRRFNKSDLIQVLQLFYDTVHNINSKDYSKQQLDAWGVKNPDKTRWMNSLENNISYVVEINETIIGFGDLNDKKYIDRLFSHKDYQGVGVASKILNTLELRARELGYSEVYTEASITAKPFFESKGFKVMQSQNKHHNGQVFINYIMKKELH